MWIIFYILYIRIPSTICVKAFFLSEVDIIGERQSHTKSIKGIVAVFVILKYLLRYSSTVCRILTEGMWMGYVSENVSDFLFSPFQTDKHFNNKFTNSFPFYSLHRKFKGFKIRYLQFSPPSRRKLKKDKQNYLI